MPMTKTDKKTVPFNIRVSTKEKAAFVRAAQIAGVPISSWVRERLRSAAFRELDNVGEGGLFWQLTTEEKMPHSESEQPIDVVKTTLGGALRNGPLRVPKFQREYSWVPTRVRKLFDDIHNAMVKRQGSYFLGTVVLTPGSPPCVVDGQQRLATTTIFLAAVRDAFLDMKKEKDAKSVEEDFLLKYDRAEKEQVCALR